MRHPILALVAVLLAPFAQQLSAETPFPPETVVAARGGVQITLQDVDDYMQRVPAKERPGVMNSSKRVEALLLNMLLNEQLAKQAEDKKLDVAGEAVGKTGWQRVEILSRLRVQEYMKEIHMPDFEVLAREEYQAYKSRYATPGRIDVQRVVVLGETPMRERKASWERAEELRKQAVANPAGFADLVKQESEEAKKGETNGIIENVAETAKGVIATTAAQLEHVGDISDVFWSKNDGFTFLKLVRRDPPVVKPYAEVKESIITGLKNNFVEAHRHELIDTLSSEKIDANPDAVASLRTRYLSIGAQLPEPPPANPSGATPPGSAATPPHS